MGVPAPEHDTSSAGARSGLLSAVRAAFRKSAPGVGAVPVWRRGILSLLVPGAAPLDLQILGRTLFHAALVGVAAGLVGAGFFAALEFVQHIMLEDLAGYMPLRAHGERIIEPNAERTFRPWLLLVLPAAGALGAGLLTRLAPETRGGGGDAMIRAFHHHGGKIRRRVAWIKALASIFTLGTGGSGGREGPTMQIGGALGSFVARALKVSALEHRVLMVAGVAAGMAAVFRTPLGAALLAVEVLYRDDFESEALIPAVLASVIAYSVVISIYGQSLLFARAPEYTFVPQHLPLYALLALLVALVAVTFVKTLHGVGRLSAKLPGPAWTRPAVGGLALGVMAVPLVLLLGTYLHTPGAGLGILGGGYGAAQMAITGSAWLPGGWAGVELLLGLCAAKLVASSLSIGTGGSAGDFGPSLVLGGLLGGAFGRAAQLLLHDPRIDPGAFALVGMGTFYGGVAHVPVSSLILVSELAGSYDLLVPLMLAEGIAFVALRKHTLYRAQVPTRKDSPVHRADSNLDVLRAITVGAVLIRNRPLVSFGPRDAAREVLRRSAEASEQSVFPVFDGKVVGLVTSDTLRFLASEPELGGFTIAADIMHPPAALRLEDDLRTAAETMVANGVHQVPVTDHGGHIVGLLDEGDVSRAYLEATAPPPPVTATPLPDDGVR